MTSSDEFVLDSSVALSWCFADEQDPFALSILAALARATARVPALWAHEIANVLLLGERRGRLAAGEAATFVALLDTLPIRFDPEATHQAYRETLEIARAYKLTAYDAAYLEMAKRLTLPLATLDARLKAAAEAAGVGLYEPP